MNRQEAVELVFDTMDENGIMLESKVIDLVLEAYDRGWSEGREDLREEDDPTEYHVFRESR